MFDWMAKHKLFSGLGTALIILIITGGISYWKNSTRKPEPTTPTQAIASQKQELTVPTQVATPQLTEQAAPSQVFVQLTEPAADKTSQRIAPKPKQKITSKTEQATEPITNQTITPRRFNNPVKDLSILVKQIETAPPLSRDKIAKDMAGIPVDLETTFSSGNIENEDGNQVLSLSFHYRPIFLFSVSCEVSLNDYPAFKVMPEGTPVRVVGIISEISPYNAFLTDAILYFDINDTIEEDVPSGYGTGP